MSPDVGWLQQVKRPELNAVLNMREAWTHWQQLVAWLVGMPVQRNTAECARTLVRMLGTAIFCASKFSITHSVYSLQLASMHLQDDWHAVMAHAACSACV